MEEIISGISNVGFPVVMTIFLLIRLEKKMDELTKAISELVIMINKNQDFSIK